MPHPTPRLQPARRVCSPECAEQPGPKVSSPGPPGWRAAASCGTAKTALRHQDGAFPKKFGMMNAMSRRMACCRLNRRKRLSPVLRDSEDRPMKKIKPEKGMPVQAWMHCSAWGRLWALEAGGVYAWCPPGLQHTPGCALGRGGTLCAFSGATATRVPPSMAVATSNQLADCRTPRRPAEQASTPHRARARSGRGTFQRRCRR